MSTIVTRIYETYGDALSATNELARNGFGKDAVSLVSNAPNREAGTQFLMDKVAASLADETARA